MYYETDKMGITHHSNYIRFMEEARVDFLEQIGWPYEKLEALGVSSPVIGINCEFKSPTTFSDVIGIEVYIAEFGGARLKIGYTMKNSSGKVVCEAQSAHCFLTSSGRPIRLARELPEFAKALEDIFAG